MRGAEDAEQVQVVSVPWRCWVWRCEVWSAGGGGEEGLRGRHAPGVLFQACDPGREAAARRLLRNHMGSFILPGLPEPIPPSPSLLPQNSIVGGLEACNCK